jgi:hypothetical protein
MDKRGLGFVFHNYKRFVKVLFIDHLYPSSIKRYKFLSLLQKNNKIDTDFIYRTQIPRRRENGSG